MLILSRRPKESIVFPSLGIAVYLNNVSGSTTQFGVEAPDHIRILRGELVDAEVMENLSEIARKNRHQLRNDLNLASLALELGEKQLQLGRTAEAEKSLVRAKDTFAEVKKALVGDIAEKEDSSDCKSKRILIVEDNSNERELLSGFMELHGYEVASVVDGVEAIDFLETNDRPDFVLLDMQLPRMDGRKTIEIIRSNSELHGLKLFALSGMERGEWNVPIGHRGVDRWFTKPLSPARFANAIAAELN